MSENLLEIKDLHVSYGGIQAVKGIDIEVPKGEIVTLIGANGAGKSTTLRTIAGLVKAKKGSIKFKGNELRGMKTNDIVAKGITLVPEGRRVFPDLTVLE
ncbi:MAG: ATP-binding cassette domain-containing protein, partial [Lachnospiraceae bacterium]|nr:ATP-binding cassette domain-containing protein [Lachnospiraceae bacterium]